MTLSVRDISPAIECQAEREGQRCGFKGSAVQGKWTEREGQRCGFKGSAVQGKWINKEDEGE
jgi:hypothetical protein